MSKRRFASILGILLVAIGLAGFLPPLVWPPPGAALAMGSSHGLLFGMLPVNAVLNAGHSLLGLWGLAARRSDGGAIRYARGVAVAGAVLALMGMVPGLDDLFGLMPLYGNDIWLHLGLAMASAYVGWAHRS